MGGGEKNGILRMGKYRLHPLIHTFASETSAQDVEKKKAKPRTPHLLSLNQDIVARSEKQKCGLKYVIYTLVTSALLCVVR